MLELHATDGFAGWFGGLADELAEQVAAGVELIEQLGPERAPAQSSELLLWFQCEARPALRFERQMADFTRFSARVRRVLKHLESDAVRRKLKKVSGEQAAQAFAALRRIAERAHSLRLHLWDGEPAWEEMEALSRSVYKAIGVEMPSDTPETGLREWNLTSCTPGLRVLYGVDAERSRGLLISGESLDRSAYGPSVRRALALWSEFLDGSLEQRVSP
jgi:hypothetical protein